MLKKSFLSLFLLLGFSVVVFGQKVYTPAKGSTERTAILNSLRVPVEKELKQKIQFSVQEFKSNGTWAFLFGAPLNTKSERPDYSNTEYQEAIEADMFDNNISALLKKNGGKWKVITYTIGCTDVCYADWWKVYKAPKTIFPYTE